MDFLTYFMTYFKTKIREFIRSVFSNEDRDSPEEHEVSGYYRKQQTAEEEQWVWVDSHERGGKE